MQLQSTIDDDKTIDEIRKWYPGSGMSRFGLTMGGIIDENFWMALLGDDKNGWLSSEHIYGWINYLYRSRVSSDRWSIFSPYFQIGTFNRSSTMRFSDYYDGKEDPYQAIADVDEVYVPLNIKDLHWFLGVFNLREKTLTIFDSLRDRFEVRKMEVVCHINFAFDLWLRNHGYYEHDTPLPFAFPYEVIYADKVPQQAGLLEDCGVWVCIFIEKLIKKEALAMKDNTEKYANSMRRRMARIFYQNVRPFDFDIDMATQQMAGESKDDNVQILEGASDS